MSELDADPSRCPPLIPWVAIVNVLVQVPMTLTCSQCIAAQEWRALMNSGVLDWSRNVFIKMKVLTSAASFGVNVWAAAPSSVRSTCIQSETRQTDRQKGGSVRSGRFEPRSYEDMKSFSFHWSDREIGNVSHHPSSEQQPWRVIMRKWLKLRP